MRFFMVIKEIGIIVIAVVAVFSLVSYLSFSTRVAQDTSRMTQGDPSAASDLGNAVSDEATGEIEWGVGIALLIAVCSALGLGSIVAILKKCD